MVLIDLVTRTGRSLVVLNNVTGVEYDEQSGELSFVGENVAKPVYLDKGTSAEKVWDLILEALKPTSVGNAFNVQGVRVILDVRAFQAEEPSF